MSLVLGVGVSSGADPVELRALATAVLADNGFRPKDVVAVVTLDAKSETPAVVGLAEAVGAEVLGYPASTLDALDVPNPSRAVGRAVGTSSVAEAAVLAHGARLVVGKTARGRCTVAVGAHEHAGLDDPIASADR
jgi:cobalt-precorrin 5A hydrolase / precorrin-3B C17-methyltransferase